MSEFRYCKLSREWILFAPSRAKRPNNFLSHGKNTNKEINVCPFEVGNEMLTPKEIDRQPIGSLNWKCRVVPNLYNSLSIEQIPISSKDGFFEKRNGFGAHEVIIETPQHDLQMHDYTIENFVDYFSIIKRRVSSLKNDVRLKYISLFKNCGGNSGATLAHSHSQLIGFGFLPKKEAADVEYFKNYFQEHNRVLFDDIIYDEKQHKKGIIYENVNFIVFAPYAAKFPFEIIVASKKNLKSLIYFDDEDLYGLSEAMEFAFTKLYKTLNYFSFNLTIKNAPLDTKESDDSYRFYVRIIPRLYSIGGLEIDSEIYTNTILPEEVARVLKD